MKMLLPFLFAPMSVFAVTTSNLPSAEFADTEVSTNIAFAVERPAMTRIEFSVALDATLTNNVEVAVGTDANVDGTLSVEESAYAFGYDCGTRFARRAGVAGLGSWAGLGGGRVERTLVLKRRQLDTAWNLVKVTRRGCGAVCELVEANGRKPGFKLEAR